MTANLEVVRSSATTWGGLTGLRALPVVSKLIDTSTCIGCKACEVSCAEWNDLPAVKTVQTGSYQTMPETHASFWNLIKFREQEHEGGFAWLFRKDQCMHCADPGCLTSCPAPGAIVQYANGIVDVDADKCIGCGYCSTGCPFSIPKFHEATAKMQKCTLCVDRSRLGLEPACVKSCPTGCLHFGTKEDMLLLATARVAQLKKGDFKNAALYDPPGVGGTCTGGACAPPPTCACAESAMEAVDATDCRPTLRGVDPGVSAARRVMHSRGQCAWTSKARS